MSFLSSMFGKKPATPYPPLNLKSLTDRRGNRIAVQNIKPQHIEEHILTMELLEEGRELSARLKAFREKCLTRIPAHRVHIAEAYEANLRANRKGNMTISTYDGRGKVEVRVTEFLTFGAELSAAKEVIDNCIRRWSEGSDAKIKTLIDDAFQTDAKNRINVQRVLGLRQYNFDDAEWQKAMQMISDAVRVAHSKSYVTISEFDAATDRLVSIPLSISNV